MRTSDELARAAAEIDRISNGIRYKIQSREQIDRALRSVSQTTERMAAGEKALSDGLSSVASQYMMNEKQIEETMPAKKTLTFPAGDQKVFDENGSYGGDQAHAAQSIGSDPARDKVLFDTVRKYYPDMTDDEINDYLKKMQDEGCAYVAIVNTIFAAFEGRPEDFEKTFGFPMYYRGDMNYDQLLIDFYASTDNHFGILSKDFINPIEDSSTTTGKGADDWAKEYRTGLYLKGKGVDVSVRTGQHVTVDNFKDYAKDGYVMVDYRDGTLQSVDGKPPLQYTGNHSMTVTGVTDDGRFIVSSGGGKYYIEPGKGKALHL